MKYLLMTLVLACVGAFAYDHYVHQSASLPADRYAHQSPSLPAEPAPRRVASPVVTPPSVATEWRPSAPSDSSRLASAAPGCDGRTHCSHMRSCADAKSQMHCPGASMDGDGDGIPCETQWCN